MTDAPSPPPSSLPYVDLPSQFGVVVDRTPDGVTITVPLPPRRSRVPIILMCANYALLMLAAGVVSAWFGIWWIAVIALVNVLLVMVVFAKIFRAAENHRRANPVAAVVRATRDGLDVRAPLPGSRELTVNCRRDEVLAVDGDVWGRGVLLTIRGRDEVEILRHHPREVRRWLAQTLVETLGLPPPGPPNAGHGAGKPADSRPR